ncbi:hypothetical protein BJ085DRAFT_5616, partial [Dimargaris cristalligena]
YLLAKSYFDAREFDRASFILQPCVSRTCRFLRLYSKFMAGERRKEELAPSTMASSSATTAPTSASASANRVNQEIPTILQELTAGGTADPDLDGFELYLLGLCFRQQNLVTRALEVLVQSVHQYPYNWSAWLELGHCVTSVAALETLSPRLPHSFMTPFFLAHARLELHAAPATMESLARRVHADFPASQFLGTLRAMAHYHAREFEEAEALFDALYRRDPYRLDQADVYSNILYVMENRAKLSYLAHQCTDIDRFRPETCCVIGNYYGLRGEHEKAVVYFQRALKLNPRYLSAWTLMGHEYVEMKNTAAAIEAYRRAIDIEERDHRAWSGLGQTYEFLKMPHYALFYYQKAAALRPFDTRLWSVLAGCYDLCQRYAEAIQCYHRALLESENEFVTLIQLAKLYVKTEQSPEALEHYQLAVKS